VEKKLRPQGETSLQEKKRFVRGGNIEEGKNVAEETSREGGWRKKKETLGKDLHLGKETPKYDKRK